MKLCDLTQFYSPVSGGVKRYLSEKIRYLREHRPDASHVLIIPGEKDEVIREERSVTYVIGSPLISKASRYRALLRLGAVEQVLETEKPSMIESGDPYQMAWKAQASGRGLGMPVVGFYHSHFPEAYLRSTMKFFGQTAVEMAMEISRRYIRHLYNRFAQTIVPSAGLAALLEEWGVRNTVTIELGVDTEAFRPDPGARAAVRRRLGIGDDEVLLLYVGRLAPEKNTRTLFKTFELLHQLYPGRYHLMVTGDGTQRRLVAELRERTGAVTWQAYCQDTGELTGLYNAADLFVHPGILETFGLVTLESQACGTPVVGIQGSYMDRIVFSDQSHWARRNHPEALAEAVHAAASGDLSAIGAETSRRVREVYSWNRVFERLIKVYETCIEKGRVLPP